MTETKSIWFLRKVDCDAAFRHDGMLDGATLSAHFQAEGSLEEVDDYKIVQTTNIDNQIYVLGITSDGTFRWFDDVAGLGDMALIHSSASENERNLITSLMEIDQSVGLSPT